MKKFQTDESLLTRVFLSLYRLWFVRLEYWLWLKYTYAAWHPCTYMPEYNNALKIVQCQPHHSSTVGVCHTYFKNIVLHENQGIWLQLHFADIDKMHSACSLSRKWPSVSLPLDKIITRLFFSHVNWFWFTLITESIDDCKWPINRSMHVLKC